MEAGRGDERGDQPDEVVVHVAWVAQGGSAGRHDGGHLWRARPGDASQQSCPFVFLSFGCCLKCSYYSNCVVTKGEDRRAT